MKLLKFGLLAAAIIAVAHAEEEFDEGEFFLTKMCILVKLKFWNHFYKIRYLLLP